ncbi:primase-like DNA-binding domain-containing protein [Chloroflexota bacterium]
MAATQEYQQESDILAGFISDRCIEHPKVTIKASELYSTYKQWAESEGMGQREVLTATSFGRRMRERYPKERKGGTVYYHGIGLSGQLQDSFEANDTGNDIFPIYNNSRVITKKTILDYPVEAKTGENYPTELPACPDCGKWDWTYYPDGELVCSCGYRDPGRGAR